LETIIRLSTAHAKLRLAKKISLVDVGVAIELLNFALTNDAEPEERKKKKSGKGGDDDEESDGFDGDGGDDEEEDVEMGDDEDAKMMDFGDDDDENSNKNKRRGRKRKMTSPDQGEKRVRRSEADDAENSENLSLVTQNISNYFKANRTGQVEKSELLVQINKDGDAEMSQDELDKILKRLHAQNKIFYLDPVVHQL